MTASQSIPNPQATQVLSYLQGLQNTIVTQLEALDGGQFLRDQWQRPAEIGGGGGTTCILENGQVFERAGVGFSHVLGAQLPPTASAHRPDLTASPWQAMGVSLVLHPRNPYVPTVHLNVRFFQATPKQPSEKPSWWFGGGMDLTPYYGFEEDATHFHRTCKNALDAFDSALYPRYKKQCDDYFFLKHRNEARGIGGIFFDDLNQPNFEQCFALMQSVGNAFVNAYLPLVQRRMNQPFGVREREFQAYRRTRYVEFNLVHDRGTLFGLQSNGRTESILMSMPPTASWRYQWSPAAGSPEAALYERFLPTRDWLSHESAA